jgi:hypothetical protein
LQANGVPINSSVLLLIVKNACPGRVILNAFAVPDLEVAKSALTGPLGTKLPMAVEISRQYRLGRAAFWFECAHVAVELAVTVADKAVGIDISRYQWISML